jgi:hypothetical protein
MNKEIHVPTPVLILGVVLVMIGIGASAAQFFAPSSMFAGLPPMSSAIQNLTWSVGARSFAQAVALAIALLARDPGALFVVFTMRALTEAQDVFVMISTGSAPVPAIVLILAFMSVFIVPEILAARWALRARNVA